MAEESESPSFGDLLRDHRKRRKMTQAELGRAINVSDSVISKYESGSRTPKREVVLQLENALGVMSSELLIAARYLPRGAAPTEQRRAISVDALTVDEEAQVREYVAFILSQRRGA